MIRNISIGFIFIVSLTTEPMIQMLWVNQLNAKNSYRLLARDFRGRSGNLTDTGGAFQNRTQGPLIDRQEMIAAISDLH